MFRQQGADIFIPDGTEPQQALRRTTRMCIAAHPDDIEMMASHGILQCFGRQDEWFCGVVATNGAGCLRHDPYSAYTDGEMQRVRWLEQKKAAFAGEYGAAVLLGYSSAQVKDRKDRSVVEDLKALISAARPRVIYTHNLADKHDTHVSVGMRVIAALRELPEDLKPEKLYGCELWRSLDWINDEEKKFLDLSERAHIMDALIRVFDSQISAKRYDLAAAGRSIANAVFADPYNSDRCSAVNYAMDLTPLIRDKDLDPAEYVEGYINRFARDTLSRIRKYSTDSPAANIPE